MIRITAFAALLAAAPAFSAPAPALVVDKDLSARFGPVRDQKDIGWCYANAAADMLDWKYGITGRQISAAHVALQFNRHWHQQSTNEGGFVGLAMYRYSRNPAGFCAADALENPLFTTLGLRNYHDVTQHLEALRSRLNTRDRAAARTLAIELFRRLGLDEAPPSNFIEFLSSPRPSQNKADELADWLADALCAKGRYMRPSRPLALSELAVTLNHNPSHVQDEINRRLGTHFTALPDATVTLDFGAGGRLPVLATGGDLSRDVLQQLQADRPVAISYSSGFLETKGAPFRYNDGHASVIVGAQCAAGDACRFKVRNSWGARCSYGNPDVQATCLANPGYYWIDAATLNRYVLSIAHFR